MSRVLHRGWPESVAWKNDAALEEAGTDTLQCAKNLRRAGKLGNNTQLTKIIRQGAMSILKCVTVASDKWPKHELDLSGAGDAFLDLAMNIETLLSNLLSEKEEALNALGQEEMLSRMMAKVNLT
jgi:hypothetical protein